MSKVGRPEGTFKNPELVREVANLRALGSSQAEIARMLEVTRAAMCQFEKRWRIPPLPAPVMRRCLRCWGEFPSVSKGNRICSECAPVIADVFGTEFEAPL